jgi:hypothetical protein
MSGRGPRSAFSHRASDVEMARLLIAWLGVALSAAAASAQTGTPLRLAGGRAPRFLVEGRPASADARDAAVFQRRIAVALHHVSVVEAVKEIASESRLAITFSDRELSSASLVSLSSDDITVGAALSAVLFDAGVDVQLTKDGLHVVLIPRPKSAQSLSSHEPTQIGTIAGRVADAKTQEPIVSVQVSASTAKVVATTGTDGRYVLRGIPAGPAVVTFRRLGYVQTTKAVDVLADSILQLDAELTASASVLEQVVTTATGNQRVLELGHVVGTIDVADSIVGKAPVTISQGCSARSWSRRLLPA